MSSKVRIAHLGVGTWGENLLRNFLSIYEAQVVSGADLRDERLAYLRHAYPQVDWVVGNDVIFKDPSIDAVIIAAPPIQNVF